MHKTVYTSLFFYNYFILFCAESAWHTRDVPRHPCTAACGVIPCRTVAVLHSSCGFAYASALRTRRDGGRHMICKTCQTRALMYCNWSAIPCEALLKAIHGKTTMSRLQKSKRPLGSMSLQTFRNMRHHATL